MLALDALGNPVRREILRRLRSQPASVAELAASLPISRPAVSRHLRLLEQARLVRFVPRGRQHVYEAGGEGFGEAISWLDEFWDDATARYRGLVEQVDG